MASRRAAWHQVAQHHRVASKSLKVAEEEASNSVVTEVAAVVLAQMQQALIEVPEPGQKAVQGVAVQLQGLQ